MDKAMQGVDPDSPGAFIHIFLVHVDCALAYWTSDHISPSVYSLYQNFRGQAAAYALGCFARRHRVVTGTTPFNRE